MQAAGIVTSLPNRHKEPNPQFPGGPSFRGDVTRNLFDSTTDQIMEQAGPGKIIDLEMDFSSDFGNLSDRNNPPSDHPTPSTLNSSSHTSYSIPGAEDPQPGTKQQNSSSNYPSQGSGLSFDKINSTHMPADMGSMDSRFHPGSSDSPSMPPESSGSFAMPPAWDFAPQTPAVGNTNLSSLNMETFSESQWAQILGTQVLSENEAAPGWENWRPS